MVVQWVLLKDGQKNVSVLVPVERFAGWSKVDFPDLRAPT